METAAAPLPSRTFTVAIARAFGEAYEVAWKPETFARWASGLATSLAQVDGAWVAETPQGRVTVRFAPRNDHGVLDHHVTLPSGQELAVPMRLIPSGGGCEVVFTLQRLPGVSDEAFAKDVAWVERDLQALKALLEDRKASPAPEPASPRDRKIDYIEWSAPDLGAAKAFYASAFGWPFTDYGPGYAAFSDGRIAGGFTTAEASSRGGALVILYADDLEAALARVEAAGGTIVKPPFAFPGGRRFHFTDPAGHELAIWSER